MNKHEEIFWNVAKEMSKLSDYKGPHIGCVCVYHKHIITSGYNQNKTNPIQQRYNKVRGFDAYRYPSKVHAEVNALNSLIGKKDIKFGDIEVFIYREDNSGKLLNCRPCTSCMALIRALGIKHIHYTSNGCYCCEKVDNSDYNETEDFENIYRGV